MDFSDKIIKFFIDVLCKTPRATYHEDLIADRLTEFAEERGFKTLRDKKNNVIAYKPGTGKYAGASTPVILQAHTDMVCVPASADFSEGIEAYFSEERRMTGRSAATGEKTTLGADNGIGAAVIMAVLDSGDDIVHPPLIAVFTAEEECGLTGARDISKDDIVNIASGFDFNRAAFINIDDGRHGQYSVGCAGSANVIIKVPAERMEYLPSDISYFELTVSGLTGGHSGLSIHEMRANANIVLCDAVRRLRYFGVHTYLLGLGRCGDAANAIPSRASAELAVPTVQKEPLDKIAAMIENIFRDKYRSTDPELSVKIRAIEGAAAISENAAMKTKDKRNNAPPDEYPTVHGQTPYSDETVFALTQIAASVLDGPIAYNAAMPQLVETSSNLGIIKDEGAHIAMTYMVRSFVDAVREQVVDDMLRTAARCGAVSESGNRSPGWVYKAENRLRDIFLSKYKELFGAEAVASAVHAGLECGHFADKFREFENMDFISCGPTITEVHSINETLHTDTVPKFGKLLVEVLGSL